MFEDKTKWDRERIMNFSGVNEKENLYKISLLVQCVMFAPLNSYKVLIYGMLTSNIIRNR